MRQEGTPLHANEVLQVVADTVTKHSVHYAQDNQQCAGPPRGTVHIDHGIHLLRHNVGICHSPQVQHEHDPEAEAKHGPLLPAAPQVSPPENEDKRSEQDDQGREDAHRVAGVHAVVWASSDEHRVRDVPDLQRDQCHPERDRSSQAEKRQEQDDEEAAPTIWRCGNPVWQDYLQEVVPSGLLRLPPLLLHAEGRGNDRGRANH
mmetsp:Transcript_25413/g.72812  ORF Transcript_25413/g.72812 Transcript_25413/m.72812 type:complete len:204 (+) Transcript_25413:1536-2147(+)